MTVDHHEIGKPEPRHRGGTLERLACGSSVRSNQAADTELCATEPPAHDYSDVDHIAPRELGKDGSAR